MKSLDNISEEHLEQLVEKLVRNFAVEDIAEWLTIEGYTVSKNYLYRFKRAITHGIGFTEKYKEKMENVIVNRWEKTMERLSEQMEELEILKKQFREEGDNRSLLKSYETILKGLYMLMKKMGQFKPLFQSTTINVEGNINLVKEVKQQVMNLISEKGRLEGEKVILDDPEFVEIFKKKKLEVE